jgi:hypothetical protein
MRGFHHSSSDAETISESQMPSDEAESWLSVRAIHHPPEASLPVRRFRHRLSAVESNKTKPKTAAIMNVAVLLLCDERSKGERWGRLSIGFPPTLAKWDGSISSNRIVSPAKYYLNKAFTIVVRPFSQFKIPTCARDEECKNNFGVCDVGQVAAASHVLLPSFNIVHSNI